MKVEKVKTCPYCGSHIEKVTDSYHCCFCEMDIPDRDVQENGQRKDHLIYAAPDPYAFSKSTPELLQMKTIELLFLLKEARKHRTEIYNIRLIGHKAKAEGLQEATFEEYEKATRKVWVIENILKDRMGYYPKKITSEFLRGYIQRIEQSQQKRMVIKEVTIIK